jgi:hypothetical protein
MLTLVLSLTQYGFSISIRPVGESLKRPMKQVQGMVQDDRSGKFQISLVRLELRKKLSDFRELRKISALDNRFGF